MRTRRGFLATAGALTAGALAGCASTGGGGGSSTSNLTHVDVKKPVDVSTVSSMPTPVRGDPQSSVTVAVFEDYACPHCAHYATEIEPKVIENYTKPGKVRYEHHDFPIPVSKTWSWAAANAARAVQDAEGDDAFFSYTHTLFENQTSYVGRGSTGYDYLATVAQRLGADPTTVAKAAMGGKYDPVLKTDRQKGVTMGVKGTPTVFVNGSATKSYAYDTISAAIDAARSSS